MATQQDEDEDDAAVAVGARAAHGPIWGGGVGDLPKVGFVWVDKQPGTALGGHPEAAAFA